MDYTWTARERWVGPLDTTVDTRTHLFTVGAPASFKPSDPHPSAVECLLGALSGDLLNGFGVEAARAGVAVELAVIGETGDPGVRAIRGTLYVSADADLAEPVAGIVARVREALPYLPPERLFLNPDCGFGTFATRPITTPEAATHKLAAMAAAAAVLRADCPPEGERAC